MEGLAYSAYWRQVLSHVHDHVTWYNFALVCKDFSQWCRLETNERRWEFRVSIREWLSHYTRTKTLMSEQLLFNTCDLPQELDDPFILPNGKLHGRNFWEAWGYLDVYNGRGVIVVPNSTTTVKFYFVRNVLFQKQHWGVTLFSYTSKHFIDCLNCPLCGKCHMFLLKDGNFLTYQRTCLERNYYVKKQRNIGAWYRKLKIARSILDYAFGKNK